MLYCVLCVLQKFMRFATKKAFTMMEIVVLMFLLTIGFFSIVSMLNNGMRFTQIIKTKIVAINLAREGIESMFQIRDTNRQRRSSNRDKCWLKVNPLVDEIGGPGDEWCDVLDKRLGSGSYIIVTAETWGQKYFEAQKIIWEMNIKDWVQPGDLNYSLCFSGERYPCPLVEYTWWEWKFFRQIEGKWLFLKDSNTDWWDYIDCKYGSEIVWSDDCGDNSAKEYRFCSKVEYENGKSISDVEICSLMTNFLE
jgi:hypothetical protein